MECSHSQTSQTLGTSQTQSHSTFWAHGMQPLTNLTNTWDFTDSVSLYILGSWNAATHKPHKHLGLYRLSLTLHFELMECSHSQISQTLGTLQTQSHSTFRAHGMQLLTNLTNTWDFTDSVSLN